MIELAPLRAAYRALLVDAASRTFAAASDGGWNAGQVLAHVIISDRDFASLCAASSWNLTPPYDNRASQTASYQDAVVCAAGSWAALVECLRRGSEELLQLLASLDNERAGHVFTLSGVMGERELSMQFTIAEFVAASANQHLPSHHQQLLALAAVPA